MVGFADLLRAFDLSSDVFLSPQSHGLTDSWTGIILESQKRLGKWGQRICAVHDLSACHSAGGESFVVLVVQQETLPSF